MDTSSTTPTDRKPATVATDWLLTNFAQFEKSLNGGAKLPLHTKRKNALADYQRLGFPVVGQEDWKYTNPAIIQEKAFALYNSSNNAPESEADLESFYTKDLESLRITIKNGCLPTEFTETAGVEIKSLKTAQKEGGKLAELVEKHLASHAGSSDAFIAMNTSLMDNALIVHIAAGVKVNKVVEILFLADESASQKTILPRILVVAEKNSEVTFIEHYANNSVSAYSVNSVVEFVAAENTNLSHYRVQNEGLEAFHVSTIAASLSSNANFSTHTFSFGGRLVRNNVNITLNGSNCNVVMNGLTAVTEKQHVDNHTLLDNTQPNCESNELYKGIYADASQGVFSGSIIVRQAAQKTNAIQSNKSLLLSDQAAVNTKPQLKIWADDVKCTHGATIGQLDDDAMFYIRSRGVSEKDAKVMLVHAFASEVISGVKVPELKEQLEIILLKKLNLEN